MAEQIRISVTTGEEKPNYKKTAAALLDACRRFYQDPENEAEYQRWKKEKDEKRAC